MSQPLPLNNDSHHSYQSSSQRRTQNTHWRSGSPQHKRSRSGEQPNYHQRRFNGRQDQDFSYGTNPKAHPICAICLGSHMHNVFSCDVSRTWDGHHVTLAKRSRGDLCLRGNNAPICMEWQRARGCFSTKHDTKHVCSGCGTASHGAQGCPQAQTA